MRLYLVQHGQARSEAEDPNRSLTDKGKADVRRVAEAARKLDVRPATILHSGKLRAQQTGELFGEALRPTNGIELASGLAPNDPAQPWLQRLNQEQGDLMLVGHLPHLDRLSSLLLCGNEQAGVIRFRNGAIICLERQSAHWAVEWILTPEMA